MIKPLKDYVLLEVKQEEKNINGFIIPESKDKPRSAKVIAVGPGKVVDGKLVPVEVKVGDVVVYKEYSTTEYEENNKKYLLIKAEDLLAVIE